MIDFSKGTTTYKVAELVSLGLTPLTLVLGAVVVALYTPFFFRAILNKDKSATDWLRIGIAIGFMGAVLDNAYWFLPWSADYLGLASHKTLNAMGVYFNIFSRQLAGTFAGYCHIIYVIKLREKSHGKSNMGLPLIVAFSLLFGCAYVAVLMWLKV